MQILKPVTVTMRLTVAGVLIYAAVAKVIHPPEAGSLFRTVFSRQEMLGWSFIGMECVLGAWLCAGVAINWSCLSVILFLSALTGSLLVELGRDHPKPCGCLGRIAVQLDPHAIKAELAGGVVRNTILMLFVATVFYSGHGSRNASGTSSARWMQSPVNEKGEIG